MLPALDEGMNNCDESSLGDLFLAPAYIQRQCHHHNNDFNNVMMVSLDSDRSCYYLCHHHNNDFNNVMMVSLEQRP